MKRLLLIALIAFAILAASAHAQTYPYEYTYVTSYVTFDENGKAVATANFHPETLSANEVKSVTFKVPYDDLNIWYVKEFTQEYRVYLNLQRDYSYDYETDSRVYTGKITYNIYESWGDTHEHNLDVDTAEQAGKTYITIGLTEGIFSNSQKESLVDSKKEELEDNLAEFIQEFNESGEEYNQYEYTVYEETRYLTIKYSIPDAIEVGALGGTLEFLTITDTNAPIEVLTIGVNAPYGYEFLFEPDFPVATRTEMSSAGLGMLASTNSFASQLGVSKGAVSSENIQQVQESTVELMQMVEPDITTPPHGYDLFDYVEIRTNIDAGESITVEGTYRTERVGFLKYLRGDYALYILAFIAILILVGVAQKKYKLFWQ